MKITLEFNTDEASNIEALQNFFAAISGTEQAEALKKPEPKKDEEEKPKKAAAKPKAKKPEPKKAEEETPEVGPKIEDVRKALGEVIANKGDSGREKAAAKLKELDASNVSTLSPEHYETFIDFLQNI